MKVFKRVMSIVILIWIIIGIVLVCKGYIMYRVVINEMPLEEKIASIEEKENYTKLDELPKIYTDAVVSVEDHRFYRHNGIDIVAIGRAMINDIKAMDFVQGGSTITQQLAKNMYFTQEKKIVRKIAEVFMAFKIEADCEKDKILELYLNTSYFGDGYYTAKEACRGYFNKELSEMSDGEAIMLAGIPNAPSVYAPTKNPDLARQRQKQVIDSMVKFKCLTEEKANEICSYNLQF